MSEETKKKSFKQPNPEREGWKTKNIAYDCWFFPVPGVNYDESVPAGSRFVPQSVWDSGKAMQLLWNFLYREFNRLRDTEPLTCDNGHDLTHEQVYTDPKRRRAKFCGKCKSENGDKGNFVYTKSALKGRERFEHYKPVFDMLRSPVGCYKLCYATEAQRIMRLATEDPTLDPNRKIQALHLHPPSYESIVNRFRETLEKWMRQPQQFDPPRYKPVMDSIRLTFKEKTGGKPADMFVNDGGKWAGVVNTMHLAPERNHRCPTCLAEGRKRKDGTDVWLNIQPEKFLAKCEYGHEHEKPAPPEKSFEYLANGYFMLGKLSTGERLNLHVAYNRPLPEMEDGLVKEVVLSGKHARPHGWKWRLIFSVQAPYAVTPRERDCVVAIDFGWRRMPPETASGPDGKEIVVAPERIRIAVACDGSRLHEIFLTTDLTCARDAKAGKKVAPKENWALEAQIGDGIQACKEALAAIDRSAWPDGAKQIWQGHMKMRETGLINLRKELGAAGITEPVLEAWHEEYWRLFKRARRIETKIVQGRTHLYRNLLDGIAKQAGVVILDDLKVKEKAERARKRVIARKKKHAETGVWDERTEAERIEEASAKWRDYVCLSDFKRFFKDACSKYGTVVIEEPHNNTCQDCGEPVEFKEDLQGQCPNGHWQEKNKNAARDMWERIGEDGVLRAAQELLADPALTDEQREKIIKERDRRAAALRGKEDAPPISLEFITAQGRKLIRALENPLARAASAD